ncbi:cystathionine gamma-lyase [Phycisphaerales bacterium]|nr:cystathionine gamma-lyase [Phycisphaerales bacterium]
MSGSQNGCCNGESSPQGGGARVFEGGGGAAAESKRLASAHPSPPPARGLATSPFGGGLTAAVRGGRSADPWSRALVTPLVQSTTYVGESLESPPPHAYSRVSNPTVSSLEARLGAIEDCPPAVCFGTGLAAETALFLATLKAGDHIVLGEAIYGGTVRLVRELFAGLGVAYTFVDTAGEDGPRNVAAAIVPETRLVFIETPANPTLSLTDIEAVARVTKRAGVLLAVDNTFLTPVLSRPLDLGADICVYSTTKHIEGHSSAMGGSITTRDEGLLTKIRWVRKCIGNIQAPFNAYLTERGLATLPLRLREHSRNAQRVAEWLASRIGEGVSCVHYPGLPDHPQHELALRQHVGGEFHGGVVSFEVAGGYDAARRLLANLRLCSLVEHVGSVETLVTHSASMTHADVPREHRLRVGITDGLVRISVGLEDPADVIADLEQGLDAACGTAEKAEGGVACRV